MPEVTGPPCSFCDRPAKGTSSAGLRFCVGCEAAHQEGWKQATIGIVETARMSGLGAFAAMLVESLDIVLKECVRRKADDDKRKMG